MTTEHRAAPKAPPEITNDESLAENIREWAERISAPSRRVDQTIALLHYAYRNPGTAFVGVPNALAYTSEYDAAVQFMRDVTRLSEIRLTLQSVIVTNGNAAAPETHVAVIGGVNEAGEEVLMLPGIERPNVAMAIVSATARWAVREEATQTARKKSEG